MELIFVKARWHKAKSGETCTDTRVAITLLLSGHPCRGLNQPSEECSWVWVVVCLWLLAVDHRLQMTPVVSQRSEQGLHPQASTDLVAHALTLLQWWTDCS